MYLCLVSNLQNRCKELEVDYAYVSGDQTA